MEGGLERMYRWLVDEPEGRVCSGISEQACRDTPRNFHYLIAANTLTKIGDALASARTTLPWLLTAVGAPQFLFALLLPIRESGSMLPQVLLAPWLARFAHRRGFWIAGSLVQGLAVLAMPAVFLLDSPLAGGVLVLALLGLFSLGRCLCSITFKDITGKTIPKTRRGRLTGLAAGVSGVFVLAVGLCLLLLRGEDRGAAVLSALLAAAAALWLLATVVFTRVREPAGEREPVSGIVRDALRDLALVKREPDLRALVLARAFLLCPVLTAPYYVLLASRSGDSLAILGWFILANGLADSLSSPLWGRFADHSSRRCLLAAGLLASLLGVAVFLAHLLFAAGDSLAPWIYPLMFFLLGMAHSGIRTARKTYVVDVAEGNQRTRYVSVSNTLIGVVLLGTGVLGALASLWSVQALILLLSLLGLGGAWFAWRLREVEDG